MVNTASISICFNCFDCKEVKCLTQSDSYTQTPVYDFFLTSNLFVFMDKWISSMVDQCTKWCSSIETIYSNLFARRGSILHDSVKMKMALPANPPSNDIQLYNMRFADTQNTHYYFLCLWKIAFYLNILLCLHNSLNISFLFICIKVKSQCNGF